MMMKSRWQLLVLAVGSSTCVHHVMSYIYICSTSVFDSPQEGLGRAGLDLSASAGQMGWELILSFENGQNGHR